MPIEKTYTAMIRKSQVEYVAICLEINVSARGVDIPDVENNLKNAINEYLEYIIESPETEVSPLSTEELIEFLKDTEPAWHRKPSAGFPLKTFEVHEVPVYV